MSESVSTLYKDALQRGHVAVVKGRPREAVSHYEEAGELAPERPLPFVRIGEIYLQMQEHRAAAAAFDAALDRGPTDLAALNGKAAALAASGEGRQAGEMRARATELEARARTTQRRGRTLDPRTLELERHIRNGAAARAAGDLGVAAAAYLTAANGFAAINDFDGAVDACLRGLEARPGNIDIHFVLTMLYLRRGWVELGVQRAELIEHRLDIDDDRVRRKALAALARDFRTLSPALERLATSAA
jgi:tetratricopeptide (TPR) repeat protein